MHCKFILASASPRRKQLLSEAGQSFIVTPSYAQEEFSLEEAPENVVKKLAMLKAKDVFDKTGKPTLGADTVVVFNGKILGKPKSEAEAYEFLSALSGKSHEVMTGVAVITDNKKVSECVVTKVVMNTLSEDFIKDYIASGRAMDKAGAYGVQDGGFVKEFVGSITNVIGLPMERTKDILKELSLWQ